MLISLQEAVEIAETARKSGKKVVTSNGCFDILHLGHLKYLEKAKKLGDILIIGVNGDNSPYFKTKHGRPIVPEKERAQLLNSLKPVDHVFIFNDETPIPWVEKIKPDFHVKATDSSYGIEQCVEQHAVEKNGKVVLIPKTPNNSTTNIIDKILRTYR